MNIGSHTSVTIYFDPGSRQFLNDRLFDVRNAAFGGDNLLAPYARLREFLNARGVEIHTADLLPAAGTNGLKIYVSSGNLTRYRSLADRPDVILSAFFAMECPTVEPDLYRELKTAQNLFRRIYSWSDSASLRPFVGGDLRCLPLSWPQSFDSVHEEIWTGRNRGFLVLINGNKVPRYKAPCRELYSERLRAVDFFARFGDIDLFGIGWDGPSFRVGQAYVPGTFGRVPMPGTIQRVQRAISTIWDRYHPNPPLKSARAVYRGTTASKAGTLGSYKFAICFENSVLKGWITEKIFDCFFAGTVPVYWGAPDIALRIPRDCFIDMREFRDYPELRKFLKSLSDRDIERYRNAARDFLKSPRFRPFTKPAFAEIFSRIIEEDAAPTLSGCNSLSVTVA
jgi:hypothetical protein